MFNPEKHYANMRIESQADRPSAPKLEMDGYT